jgi:6-phosphogluconolactonase
VSLRDDDCIACYALDGGVPAQRVDFPIAGGPAPMALHPSGELLFVGLRNSPELACIRIGPNGNLSLVTKTKLPSDPCFVCTDQTGRYVFMSCYSAGQLSVHRWDSGNNSLYEIQRLDTEKMAHSIWLDANDRFAYAPHTNPNKIYLYVFDNKTGLLAPNDPPYFSPEADLQPRHLCLHPVLPRLYVVNEGSSTLSVYSRNLQNGNIDCCQTVSTLPPYTGRANTGAEVRISPDARFIYTSNRGHDSIACFSIDTETGCVHPVGHVSTAATPRSFDLSADGHFMYVAGETSGELATYRIDNKTGMPVEMTREYVGKRPMWVMAV